MEKPKIVVIVGPTAVGKTALSIKIAKAFNGEIISADSVQVYKGLDIGSAKVTSEEMQGIRHHLIDILEPNEEYNVSYFVDEAKKSILDIISRNKLPIIVGGTGLYVSSLLYDIGAQCGKDEAYRASLEEIAKKGGTARLHKMLEAVDSESAFLIHPNHKSRIIRALEIYHVSGKKKSEIKNPSESNYNYFLIGLTCDRDALYERINLRVDKMIENGLIDEVRKLMERGINLNNQAFKAIGYKETYAFLTNQLSETEYKEKLKQNSRNYAKRQLTWFKKMPNIKWYNYNDTNLIIKDVGEFINGK